MSRPHVDHGDEILRSLCCTHRASEVRVRLERWPLRAGGHRLTDCWFSAFISLHEALARVVRELGQPQPELTVAVVQAVVDACIRRIDQGDDLATVSDFAAGATRRLLADDDLPRHP